MQLQAAPVLELERDDRLPVILHTRVWQVALAQGIISPAGGKLAVEDEGIARSAQWPVGQRLRVRCGQGSVAEAAKDLLLNRAEQMQTLRCKRRPPEYDNTATGHQEGSSVETQPPVRLRWRWRWRWRGGRHTCRRRATRRRRVGPGRCRLTRGCASRRLSFLRCLHVVCP